MLKVVLAELQAFFYLLALHRCDIFLFATVMGES